VLSLQDLQQNVPLKESRELKESGSSKFKNQAGNLKILWAQHFVYSKKSERRPNNGI